MSLLYKYLLIKLVLASQGQSITENAIELSPAKYPNARFIIKTNNFKNGIITNIIGKNKKNLNSYLNKNVTLTCIKKGLIGMPNVSLPNYLGFAITDNKDFSKCYVFLEKV